MADAIDPRVEKAAQEFRSKYMRLREEIAKAIVGHDAIVNGVLTCLFVSGHALLEGVPGHAAEALRECLGVAMLAPWRHLRAAQHRVPRRVRPPDVAALSHWTQEPQIGRAHV